MKVLLSVLAPGRRDVGWSIKLELPASWEELVAVASEAVCEVLEMKSVANPQRLCLTYTDADGERCRITNATTHATFREDIEDCEASHNAREDPKKYVCKIEAYYESDLVLPQMLPGKEPRRRHHRRKRPATGRSATHEGSIPMLDDGAHFYGSGSTPSTEYIECPMMGCAVSPYATAVPIVSPTAGFVSPQAVHGGALMQGQGQYEDGYCAQTEMDAWFTAFDAEYEYARQVVLMQESEKRKELRMGQISGGLLLGCFEDEKKKREGLVTESAVAFQQLNFTRTKLRPPSGSLRGFKRRQQGQDTSSSASVSTANSSLGAVSTSSISTSSSLQSFHQAVHPAPNAVVHILQQPRTPIQHQLPYYELHQPAPTGFYSPQPHYPYVRAVVAATPPLSRPVAAPPTHHRRAESAGAQRQKPHAIPRLPPPLVKAPPSTDRFLAEEADARMQIAIMHESNVANFEAMHAKIWFQQKLESNRREMSAEGDSGAVKSAENHGSRRDWTGAETLPDEPKEFPPPSVETKDLRRVTMSDDVDFPAKEQRRVTIAPGSVDFDTRVLAAAPHSSVASVPLAPSSVPTKSHTEAEETEGGKEHAMRMLLQAATPFLLWPVLKYLPDLTDPDNKTASKKVNTNGGRRTTSL